MAIDLKWIFPLLRPLGGIYGTGMRLRALLYERNILSRHRVRVPVISVGNLAVGGSGKTPVVIHLARLMLERGLQPAVVSRGYGGKAAGRVNLVSDGKKVFLESGSAGDEPRLIAQSVPDAVVLTGRKRIHPCREAAEHLDCDVVILDDGFQHMAMGRDVDLVLFDSATLFDHMNVLPGGVLREPFSALARADCFLFTGWTEKYGERVRQFTELLARRWPEKPVFTARFLPRCFISHDNETFPLEAVPTPVAAFCGIASPQRFAATLKELGIVPVRFTTFADHHPFTVAELRVVEEKAMQEGARALLTTEKDMVKLTGMDFRLPLLALHLELAPAREFDQEIVARLGKLEFSPDKTNE